MTQKLFEILTDEEISRLKSIGLTRNVVVGELTIKELDELKRVFFPVGKATTIMDVMNQLKTRRAL